MTAKRRRHQAPQGESVCVEVVPVPKEGFVVCRFLGDFTGIWTHWNGHRAVACPGELECEDKLHRRQTRWKGYAPVETWRGGAHQDWCPGVLEITEHGWESVNQTELRGQVWTFRRACGEWGDKEVVGSFSEMHNADQLREAFEVKPSVCRIYSTRKILWNVAPYLPPRLILPPVKGPVPAVITNSVPILPATPEEILAVLEQQAAQGNTFAAQRAEKYRNSAVAAKQGSPPDANPRRETGGMRPPAGAPVGPSPSSNGTGIKH